MNPKLSSVKLYQALFPGELSSFAPKSTFALEALCELSHTISISTGFLTRGKRSTLHSEGKKYTPKVFSALKTQVPQHAENSLVYTKKLVFKGKRRKIHIHQRGFKVFVGDPFPQYWCIDFGLLFMSVTRMHAYRAMRIAA